MAPDATISAITMGSVGVVHTKGMTGSRTRAPTMFE
jgi:hypothetical protein